MTNTIYFHCSQVSECSFFSTHFTSCFTLENRNRREDKLEYLITWVNVELCRFRKDEGWKYFPILPSTSWLILCDIFLSQSVKCSGVIFHNKNLSWETKMATKQKTNDVLLPRIAKHQFKAWIFHAHLIFHSVGKIWRKKYPFLYNSILKCFIIFPFSHCWHICSQLGDDVTWFMSIFMYMYKHNVFSSFFKLYQLFLFFSDEIQLDGHCYALIHTNEFCFLFSNS